MLLVVKTILSLTNKFCLAILLSDPFIKVYQNVKACQKQSINYVGVSNNEECIVWSSDLYK